MTLQKLFNNIPFGNISHLLPELSPFIPNVEKLIPLFEKAYKELCSITPEKNEKSGTIVVLEFENEFKDSEQDPDTRFESFEYQPQTKESYETKFSSWPYLLSCEVCQQSLNDYGPEMVAAQMLTEMTYFAFTEKEVEQQKQRIYKKLNEAMREPINENDGVSVDDCFASIRRMLGFPEITEEEKKENEDRLHMINKIIERNEEKRARYIATM